MQNYHSIHLVYTTEWKPDTYTTITHLLANNVKTGKLVYHRLDYFIASIYKTRHFLQNVNLLTWSHYEQLIELGHCDPSPLAYSACLAEQECTTWDLINIYIRWKPNLPCFNKHQRYYWPCQSKISTCSNGIMRPIMVWASPSSALAVPDGSAC